MKTLLSTLYALLMSTIVIMLLYFVAPYVVEYPKTATCILVVLMLSSIGTGLRSMIEIGLLKSMLVIANGRNKSFVFCPIVFILGLLAAIIIPWISGVSSWGVWHWIAAIAFMLFNIETFYAFIGATLRAYNAD